jgi:hypothetical protein
VLHLAKIEAQAKALLSRTPWFAVGIVASIVGAGVVLFAIWAITLMIDGPMSD